MPGVYVGRLKPLPIAAQLASGVNLTHGPLTLRLYMWSRRCRVVTVDVSPLCYNCHRVAIVVSLSSCRCRSVTVDVSLSCCDCDQVFVVVSLSFHCLSVTIVMSPSLCHCRDVTVVVLLS